MITEFIGKFFETFKTTLVNHKLKIAVICLIFIVLVAVYYKKIVAPELSKKFVENREFVPKETETESETATLYYFFTDWCPMCKQADPELKALKSETGGAVNGVNIIFRNVDCDADAGTADKFNITGYPTIKLVYKDKTYEYDAKPDRAVLNKFLNDVINNPA
jgi:thiol-disulfide isomerase/thioredoxin